MTPLTHSNLTRQCQTFRPKLSPPGPLRDSRTHSPDPSPHQPPGIATATHFLHQHSINKTFTLYRASCYAGLKWI